MYPYKIFGNFDLYMLCIVLGAAGCLVLYRLLSDRLRYPARLVNLTLASGLCGMAVGYAGAVLLQAVYDWQASGIFHIGAETGATFYGGLIGGAIGFLAVYYIAGHFFLPGREHLTMAMPNFGLVACAITLAHGVGRIGCLFAGCCYGQVTDAWYGIYMVTLGEKVVPTQLIEALFLFLLCAFLCRGALHGKPDGLPLYMILYGTFRFLLEYWRADDRGAFFLPFLSPSQGVAALMVGGGALLLWSCDKWFPATAPQEGAAPAADTPAVSSPMTQDPAAATPEPPREDAP